MNQTMLKQAEQAYGEWLKAQPTTRVTFKPKRFDPDSYVPDPGFFSTENRNTFHVYWGGYDYPVYFEEDDGPAAIIKTIRHLSRKGWPLMTVYRLGWFAETIAQARGMNIYGRKEGEEK